MNRKLTVYGSMLCPDCVEAERILKERRIAHEFINITDSMANLKAFLAYGHLVLFVVAIADC